MADMGLHATVADTDTRSNGAQLPAGANGELGRRRRAFRVGGAELGRVPDSRGPAGAPAPQGMERCF